MIEASLLPPPTVGEFIAALKAATDGENVGSKNELYADIGDQGVEVGSRGTKCTRTSSVKAILEFEVVRQDKGLTAATLDDYFELFAKFVVDPALMSENVDTQREIAQQREAMCKRANVTMHKLSTTTLRTYVTAQQKQSRNARLKMQSPTWDAQINLAMNGVNGVPLRQVS